MPDNLSLGVSIKLPVCSICLYCFNLNILKELQWIANDDHCSILELLKEKKPLKIDLKVKG